MITLSSRPFCSYDGRPGEPGVFIRSEEVHDPFINFDAEGGEAPQEVIKRAVIQ